MNAHKMNAETLEIKTKNCVKFRTIANEIALLADSVGIKITPFNDSELKYFTNLDVENQNKVLNSVEIFLNVYQAVKAEGASLLDSVRVIWNALSQLGLRPPSDLFSYIKVGHVIEIHNHESIQLFRNLNFFNYCSYSLEELYCFPLHELYSRDPAAMQQIMMVAIPIVTGKVNDVVKLDLKSHVISESKSKARLKIKDQIQFMAPLFSNLDNTIAVISIESAQLIEVHPESALPKIEMTDEAFFENLINFKPHEITKRDSL